MPTPYSNQSGVIPGLARLSTKRRRESGNIMVMFTLMLPFVLVPLVGLGIDATMLYSVKAKLQAAVDGGAIAAAQSLNSGVNFAAQQATAQKTADQFIRANFVVAGAYAGVNGYWGAFNLNDTTCAGNPCIVAAQDNANKRRTVSITASVQVPLLFMRILGVTTGTVAATGQAARRDVVLVLVIDRSSSMTPAMAALQAGATYFTNQFTSGRDRLGMVVFGGSAIVAYPPTDWNNATPTGPDTSFKDTPDSAAVPNMLTSITNIGVFSNTGTADALMLAYKELKAANQPGALNVIVLFTDGQPNGITANFNNTVTGSVKAASTCTNKTDGGVASKSMIGWTAQWGGFVAGGSSNGRGIFTRMQNDGVTQTSVTNWLKNGGEPVLGSPPSAGCAFVGNQANIPNDVNIPTVDFYGNSTLGANVAPYTSVDYQQSEIWGNECNNGSRTTLNLTKTGDACQVGLASWNAADMAGKQIRADATLIPVIYCMGYEGNGGDDPALMRRLANVNTVTNTVYDSTKPQGLYLQIATVNDITPAFQSVLAEVLRLSI
jgi:Flp pilus assembly protein TadG